MDAILVSQSIRTLVAEGAIQALVPVQPAQVQPSSLDLRLGSRLWQLQCSFLPGPQGIERKLGRLATATWSLDRDTPLVLHAGGVYLAELEEVLELPADVWGRTNPKSSTGRLDVFVRVLTEHGVAFDTVPQGYHGRLFLEITPQSFHVGVRRGDCLSQLRMARGRPGLDLAHLRQPPGRVRRLHLGRWLAGACGRRPPPGNPALGRPARTRPWAGRLPRPAPPTPHRPGAPPPADRPLLGAPGRHR